MSEEEKDKGGRPPLYESAEEVSEIVDKYFEDCTTKEEFPTISGLAMSLDMTTETLRMYGKDDKFSATIRRAKQLVEMAWEQKLLTPGSGPIFWLKNNAGWKDKQEVEQSGDLNIKIQRFTDEKADA